MTTASDMEIMNLFSGTPDVYLNRSQIGSIMSYLLGKDLSEEDCEHLLDSFEFGENVSMDRFCVVISKIVRETFESIDKSGDKSVIASDLRQHCANAKSDLFRQEIGDLIDSIAKGKDHMSFYESFKRHVSVTPESIISTVSSKVKRDELTLISKKKKQYNSLDDLLRK